MSRASDFRHRVDVLTCTKVKDAIGSARETWTTTARIWAKIAHEFRPADAYSRVSATHVYEDRTWFTTRPGVPITQAMRLRHLGRTYEILSIQDETTEREFDVRLLCREVKP